MRTAIPTDRPDPHLVGAAIGVIRIDDDRASLKAYQRLKARHGEREAARVWIEARDAVANERQGTDDIVTVTAPECVSGCGETYINDGCGPCELFARVRDERRSAR